MAEKKKLTMTAAINAAKEAAMQGRNDGFAALADFKEKIKPNVKLEIVERAAAYCDADGIREAAEALGLCPRDLASALCVAYRSGNEGAARALYELGASLGYSSFDVRKRIEKLLGKIDGSVDYKGVLRSNAVVDRSPRILSFFDGETFDKTKAQTLFGGLIDEGIVPAEDSMHMAFDVLECAWDEDAEWAIALWEKVESSCDVSSFDSRPDMKRLIGPKRCGDAVFDYGLSRATESMVREVFESGKSSFVASPERLKKVVPYLTGNEIGTKKRLIEVLAENGYVDELRVVATWSNAFTEKNLTGAIEAASAFGRTECLAYLLEEMRARYGDSTDLTL